MIAAVLMILMLGSSAWAEPHGPHKASDPSPGWGPVTQVRSVWAITFPDKAACEHALGNGTIITWSRDSSGKLVKGPTRPFGSGRCEQVSVPVATPANDPPGIRQHLGGKP